MTVSFGEQNRVAPAYDQHRSGVRPPLDADSHQRIERRLVEPSRWRGAQADAGLEGEEKR